MKYLFSQGLPTCEGFDRRSPIHAMELQIAVLRSRKRNDENLLDSTIDEGSLEKQESGVQAPMPEKRLGAFILWGMEQLLRWTLLHEPAFFEIQNLIRQPQSLGR